MPDVIATFDRQPITLRISDEGYVEPITRPAPADTRIKDFDTTGLREAFAGARRLLVVVNDSYRPTPTAAMLDRLAPKLREVEEVKIVIATGKHPGPSETELAAILGSVAGQFDVTVHDASMPGTDYGPLADGSPLELDSVLEWADAVLLLGSVEPHFFAGFTGGAKQLLPGLASARTIEANHRNAVHANCRPCTLAGNPVAAPIREVAARFSVRLWAVQGVAGPDGWEFFCGREAMAFAEATRRCCETAVTKWGEPLDVLIAVVAEPLDRNLYQLQKGFENHQWAVRDGGDLVLISSCRDGAGNEFFESLMELHPDWQALPPWEEQTYSLGLHKLYRTAAAKGRVNLWLHSVLPPEQVKKFWFEPVGDLDAWLSEKATESRRIGVVQDAAATVSEVSN